MTAAIAPFLPRSDSTQLGPWDTRGTRCHVSPVCVGMGMDITSSAGSRGGGQEGTPVWDSPARGSNVLQADSCLSPPGYGPHPRSHHCYSNTRDFVPSLPTAGSSSARASPPVGVQGHIPTQVGKTTQLGHGWAPRAVGCWEASALSAKGFQLCHLAGGSR